MLKRSMFLLLVFLAACSNPATRKDNNTSAPSPSKSRARTVKPAANPWTISAFAPKDGGTEGNKFLRFVTDGNFSDSTRSNSYLYAEVLFNKSSAGIFLHELKKSSPPEKFSKTVQINLKNSSGLELQMNSSRRWNSSGGLLIEQNNNDYSQFRIFLLKSQGPINVEIKDSGSKSYHFIINAEGFADSFSKL
jgi:hypothetical protein